jgi:hypothetical protein
MVSNAAVFMMITIENVLGLSSMRRTAEIKRIIYTYIAANVRRSLPIAKSSTKKTVNP